MKKDVTGFGRMLHYSVRQAELLFAMLVAVSVLMFIYMGAIGSYGQNMSDYLRESGLNFILLALGVTIFSSGISSAQSTYPMLLSFNARRHNIIVGSLITNLVLIAQSVVLLILVSLLIGSRVAGKTLLTILGVSLLLEGVSNLLGMATVKYGRAGYLVLMVLMMLVCAGVGGMIGFSAESGTTLPLSSWLRSGNYQLGMFLLGTGICILANFISHRLLRNYEVK